MTRYTALRVERVDGVATVTLDRPEAMNALNTMLKQELFAVFTADLAGDAGVRAVVVTGAGEKTFCAGADLKERIASEPRPAEFFASQRRTHALFAAIERFPTATIAAINGVALGGGTELALACDLRIAADTASLGLTRSTSASSPREAGRSVWRDWSARRARRS